MPLVWNILYSTRSALFFDTHREQYHHQVVMYVHSDDEYGTARNATSHTINKDILLI